MEVKCPFLLLLRNGEKACFHDPIIIDQFISVVGLTNAILRSDIPLNN
jgi:hypothetical protein